MHFSPEIMATAMNVLFIAFLSAALIQLLYIVFMQLPLLFKAKHDDSRPMPLSVILCARNESDNLHKNLPLILNQDYPEFEVIVVNHQSTDESKYILHALQLSHPRLKVIEIARNAHMGMGKKLPLSVGIKGAKHEYLIMTDADCTPSSNQWLCQMAGSFIDGKEIVLG